MKKILILENKLSRPGYKKQGSLVEQFEEVELVVGDIEIDEKMDAFLEDNSTLDQYDVVCLHANIYKVDKREHLLNTLSSYSKINTKNLVVFSGGTDSCSFDGSTLSLSAKSFYENIEMFLNAYRDSAYNILMLEYGEKWDINNLLNVLEKLNLYIQRDCKDEEIDFDEFEDDYLAGLKKVLNSSTYKSLIADVKIVDDNISLDEVAKIISILKKIIKDKINE